jgi:hypothetical protein
MNHPIHLLIRQRLRFDVGLAVESIGWIVAADAIGMSHRKDLAAATNARATLDAYGVKVLGRLCSLKATFPSASPTKRLDSTGRLG